MPSACDELDEFDRTTLREAVARGEVKLVLVREGKPDPDLWPVKARLDRMAECGFLERSGLRGSKARLAGAEYFATYNATQAGRVAIEAIDRAEAAEIERDELVKAGLNLVGQAHLNDPVDAHGHHFLNNAALQALETALARLVPASRPKAGVKRRRKPPG